MENENKTPTVEENNQNIEPKLVESETTSSVMEENSGKKKSLKGKIRIAIAATLMVGGVILCVIPIYTNYRTYRFQKDSREKFLQIVDQNKSKLEKAQASENSNNEIGTDLQEDTAANVDVSSDDVILDDAELEELIGDGGITEDGPRKLSDQMKKYGEAIYNNQKIIGLIEIDKIEGSYVIAEGWDRQNISVTIGHMEESAGIGEYGNCVLAGHRGGLFGEFFKNIDKLEEGDKIRLIDIYGMEYTYVVYESFLTKPDDMSVTEDVEGESTLTLVSCEDNAKKRLIVHARQELSKEELSALKAVYDKEKAAEEKEKKAALEKEEKKKEAEEKAEAEKAAKAEKKKKKEEAKKEEEKKKEETENNESIEEAEETSEDTAEKDTAKKDNDSEKDSEDATEETDVTTDNDSE